MTLISALGAFLCFFLGQASAGTKSLPQVSVVENLRKLAFANNEMAFNLYRKLASNNSENVFFSPLSLSSAFGMLYFGAKGDTGKELRNALGYEKADLATYLVHKTFDHFLSQVFNTNDPSNDCVLKAVNAVLISKNFDVLEKYRNHVADLYKAEVRDVDFSMEAPEVIQEINSLIKEKTNSKIENFLDNLNPLTLMVLLNAVYFKGAWKTPFEPEKTEEHTFYNNGLESEKKKVLLMHMTSPLQHHSANGFEALELPYKGENVVMFILLPNERDGLQALEDSLTPGKLEEIKKKLKEIKINVSLPKFKLEFEKELSEEMKTLGSNKIFSSDADFSGMTSKSGIFVSEIRHKAVIEVNEEGTEAAGATGTITSRMSSPDFRADHPFFFAIVEKKSNMILFMGRLNNL